MTLVAQFALGSWLAASGAYLFQRKRPWLGDLFTMLGVLAGALFLGFLWVSLGRPPLRTLGETRWWYAVTVPLMGILIGWRFDTKVLAIPSCLMGALFASINLAHPEYMDKTLMPALQSPWFVPHVVVYMVAYAALGLSSMVGAWALVSRWIKKEKVVPEDVELPHKLVMVGLPLLTTGLLFGAFWAKEAWGHYWTWDPKETWAFLTWATYLIYLHVKHRHALKPTLNIWLLVVGFAVLMGCWFGVNYLPTANESVHTYTRTE
ncbi:MAG: cytochrome c biogenesis protein CcsA [Fimbriimonadaceae bacterium]|jgi:ABC-type transport system involved in cytochrome c biogenesis permease subunit|nr:cytochrome c biogenesis protein CcsA [Fimbriimonadaceae bacterium]